jgi:hypothetical protein
VAGISGEALLHVMRGGTMQANVKSGGQSVRDAGCSRLTGSIGWFNVENLDLSVGMRVLGKKLLRLGCGNAIFTNLYT